MIIVEKARDGNGIFLKGDFFDLDRLYFAIYKYTGFHGIDSKCTFPGYDAVCENLLGLCYEIRHAWQGDRNIEQVFNGIHEDWFDDYEESDSQKTIDALDSRWDEHPDGKEAYQNDELSIRFSRKDFPDVTKSNTYFSIPLTFPEATFYSLILLELLKKKDVFLHAKKLLAEKNDANIELNKEYYYFQANEDIARMTLLTNQILYILYRFISEERYNAFINKFCSYKDFFLNCDLEYINSILEDYGEKEYENDTPDHLYTVLMSFFK